MADHGTAIEWTQAPGYKGETWNPVTGCDRVSPGCAHCYALDLAARLKGMGQKRYQRDGDPKTSGPGFGLTLHPDKLEEPLRWRKPRMVFVNSMSDLFHEAIPDQFIASVFYMMARAPQHVFQVLTKRPERMAELVPRIYAPQGELLTNALLNSAKRPEAIPLRNVWLGVSIENRRFVHRADLLRQTPAAVRFISAEPLLGQLVVREWASAGPRLRALGCLRWDDGKKIDSQNPELDLTNINWLIVGGESGPNHRSIDPQWVRDLRDACHVDDREGCYCTGPDAHTDHCHGQCQTAFFFKQWGGHTPKAGGRELDGRTWSEWPTVLQATPHSEAA